MPSSGPTMPRDSRVRASGAGLGGCRPGAVQLEARMPVRASRSRRGRASSRLASRPGRGGRAEAAHPRSRPARPRGPLSRGPSRRRRAHSTWRPQQTPASPSVLRPPRPRVSGLRTFAPQRCVHVLLAPPAATPQPSWT